MAVIDLQSWGEERTQGGLAWEGTPGIQHRHYTLDCFKQRRNIGLSAFALAFGQAEVVQAIEPEEILAPIVGPVLILPRVSLSEIYSDNVFMLSDEQEKVDDMLTSLSLGIGLQYGKNGVARGNRMANTLNPGSNYLGFDYTMDQRWYAENNELNAGNHLFDFAMSYQKPLKFTFTGTGSIRMDKSLAIGAERSVSGAWVRATPQLKSLLINRIILDSHYRFEYTISPKTSAYAAINYNELDYGEEPHYYFRDVFGTVIPYSYYDIASLNNTVGFGWQAFPKTKLYGSFFYGITKSETNLDTMEEQPDSNFFGGHISAIGDLTMKLTSQVMLGYQVREFSLQEPSNNFIFKTELGYKYTQKGTVSLSFYHGSSVSMHAPDQAATRDEMSIDVNQRIGTTGKLSANFQATYELETETKDTLEYQRLRIKSRVSYRFNQWLSSSLTYAFEMYEGYERNIDYSVNRIILGLSVGY